MYALPYIAGFAASLGLFGALIATMAHNDHKGL